MKLGFKTKRTQHLGSVVNEGNAPIGLSRGWAARQSSPELSNGLLLSQVCTHKGRGLGAIPSSRSRGFSAGGARVGVDCADGGVAGTRTD